VNSTLLRSENISKTFQLGQKRLEVLSNIEFQVHSGETVMLSGKCGQGKSVLLSLLCGLDYPTGGDIYFDGIWFSSCTQKQLADIRRNQIGIIFQNLNLIPSWTAVENVEAALEDIVASPEIRHYRTRNLLEEMGLSDRLEHLPINLSMGEQQRIAIARTLIREPRLILADEPTGDLDPDTGDQIIHILRSYVRKTNSALFVATHGIFPETFCDRILNIEHGMISQLDPQKTGTNWKLI
jgi:putative ABC transport system ATP-binding protein